MKVMRLIGTMDPATGGPCQGIRNATPEWLRMGHDVDVVCLDHPDADFVKNEKISLIPLGPSVTSWGYASRLSPWLESHFTDYDVVIVHGLWQHHGFAVNRMIRKWKGRGKKLPKVYIMPHGMLDPYFQHAPGRKLKALRNLLYWKWIESDFIENADGILFTCQEELELARGTFRPYRPRRELNVGYGVPLPPPYSPEMSAGFELKCPGIDKRPYLLFLSRIHPKKGADLLLRAYLNAIALRREGDQEIPCLVIAGPGLDTEYGRELISAVAEAKATDRVFFPGMLLGPEKWGAFYGCEAFVLPSHQENFGISVAEALSCGKPVLISNQVNIWREIVNGGAGRTEADTPQGVSKLIGDWIHTEAAVKSEMGNKAREVYDRYFEVGAAARKMIEAITENNAQ